MSDRPRLGYLIGSHVAYQHKALPILLQSMRDVGIDPGSIVVNVNGSGSPHHGVVDGVNFYFVRGETTTHFRAFIDERLSEKFGIQHWLYLNCTSRCGPRFKELAEAGFDPEADATLAGSLLGLGPNGGKMGRAINDLAVYKADYVYSMADFLNQNATASVEYMITHLEGFLFAAAPKQAVYPRTGFDMNANDLQDIYGTGVKRATEYYPGLDWYRYKKNFGQLRPGCYTLAGM